MSRQGSRAAGKPYRDPTVGSARRSYDEAPRLRRHGCRWDDIIPFCPAAPRTVAAARDAGRWPQLLQAMKAWVKPHLPDESAICSEVVATERAPERAPTNAAARREYGRSQRIGARGPAELRRHEAASPAPGGCSRAQHGAEAGWLPCPRRAGQARCSRVPGPCTAQSGDRRITVQAFQETSRTDACAGRARGGRLGLGVAFLGIPLIRSALKRGPRTVLPARPRRLSGSSP